MKEYLTFNDVVILPRFSEVRSRKDVDISSNAGGLPYMSLPVISANMDTVTDAKFAQTMLSLGAQGALHRFQSIEDNVRMFADSRHGGTGNVRIPFVSVGLGKSELERAKALLDAGAIFFMVDVAHGASIAVVEQVKELRKLLGDHASITVGNFATGDSVRTFLEHVGFAIDAVKVGLGSGSHCTTRVKTGIGAPQFSAVLDVARTIKKTGIPVISDGGHVTAGDCAKALGAGAYAVMLGGMLAGTEESPGEKRYGAWDSYIDAEVDITENEFQNDCNRYVVRNTLKKYRGSASKESYAVQNKDASWRTAEGESSYIPYKGPVAGILQDIEGGLRSSFSYVGATTLKEFHENIEFVRVTHSGYTEGLPHGKKN